MTRQCARPGCSDPASATFGYDYADRIVWLDDVADEPHPSTYDLCRRHATAMTVPQGWELSDRRTSVTPLFRAERVLSRRPRSPAGLAPVTGIFGGSLLRCCA